MKLALAVSDAVLKRALDTAGNGIAYWVNAANRKGPLTLRVRDRFTGSWHTIGRVKLADGLKVMANRCPKRFANFLGDACPDNEDADLLVQYAAFGVARYG